MMIVMNHNMIATSPNELKQMILEDFWEQYPQYKEMTPTVDAILFQEEEIESWVEGWKTELTNLGLIMKTQISHLRSGTKNQILNPEIDYTKLPKSSSHVGHSGSNNLEVQEIWEQVVLENPESMKIKIMDIEVVLTANYSKSRQSVTYHGSLTKRDLEDKFYLKAAETETPTICIQCGNLINVTNGKNSTVFICPSLIEIL